jgi:hypothetical protein
MGSLEDKDFIRKLISDDTQLTIVVKDNNEKEIELVKEVATEMGKKQDCIRLKKAKDYESDEQ